MLEAIKDALIEAATQSDKQNVTLDEQNVTLDKQNVTLEEQKIIELLIDNPNITQLEVAKVLNVTDRTIKRRMKTMQEKNLIKRENGKRNGKWVVNSNL